MAETATEASFRTLAVDEVRHPLLEVTRDLVGLNLRQPALGHGFIELRLGSAHHGLHETVDGLALVLRDLGERLTAGKPFA
jgi:hypothetical protein